MARCIRCDIDYEGNIINCKVCGDLLEEQVFFDVAKEEFELGQLTNVATGEGSMLVAYLKGYNIYAEKSSHPIKSGISKGEDIYVDKSKIEEAYELLKSYDFSTECDDEELLEYNREFSRKGNRLLIALCLIFVGIALFIFVALKLTGS